MICIRRLLPTALPVALLANTILSLTAHADDIWTGTDGLLWTDSFNWSGGVPTSTTTVDFTQTTLTTVNLNGNQTVSGVVFGGLAGYTLENNTLTIGSGGISVSNPTVGSVTHTISSSVVFNSSSTPVSVGSSTTLLLSGPSISGTTQIGRAHV